MQNYLTLHLVTVSMKWTEDAFELLKTRFEDRTFTTAEASKLLKERKGYARGTVKRILHDLRNNGFIKDLGRGIYNVAELRIRNAIMPESISVEEEVIVKLTPAALEKANELLKEKGIEFMITGASVLSGYHHHFPHRLLHLVYVVSGAGEYATMTLNDRGLRAFLDPNRAELETAFEMIRAGDFFIIREFSELMGKSDGIAVIERAIVDLYFEVTRERIPFPANEAALMISKVFRSERLSLSKLFMLAKRRGVKSEFISLVNFLIPKARMAGGKRNKHVNKILQYLEAERA